MILSNEDMTLRPDDDIEVAQSDHLVVKRIITLTVCRCRQCEDKCERLGEHPYFTCSVCNNNHSQDVDGVYRGPLCGSRGAGE